MYSGSNKCRQNFGWKASGEEPHGRHRQWSEDNITMDLRKAGSEDVILVELDQDKVQWLLL